MDITGAERAIEDISAVSEAALWSTTYERLSPFGSLMRIENSALPGTPDVFARLRHPKTNAVGSGWIELKWCDTLRDPIKIRSLRLSQCSWAAEWSTAGERVTMLLHTGSWYFMISPHLWQTILDGKCKLDDLGDASSKFPLNRILKWITT
jgi:hypothetical protein